MQVRDIMKVHPAFVVPSDLLSTASQVMLWAGGRHLPVVDGGLVVGVLSAREVFRTLANRDSETLTVRDAMSVPAHTIGANAALSTAAHQMIEQRVGCLPVLDGEDLVGMVTSMDVLAAFEHERAAFREPMLSAELQRELARLRTLRDRVKVQAHLGGMELRDVWSALESDFAQAERHAANTGDEALALVRKFRERAERTYAKLIRGLIHELEMTTERAPAKSSKRGRPSAA